jgi:hypothetical protein
VDTDLATICAEAAGTADNGRYLIVSTEFRKETEVAAIATRGKHPGRGAHDPQNCGLHHARQAHCGPRRTPSAHDFDQGRVWAWQEATGHHPACDCGAARFDSLSH